MRCRKNGSPPLHPNDVANQAAAMSALVKTDKPQSEQIESVLPPIADIERTFRDIDRMGATERGARVKPERDRHRQEAADECDRQPRGPCRPAARGRASGKPVGVDALMRSIRATRSTRIACPPQRSASSFALHFRVDCSSELPPRSCRSSAPMGSDNAVGRQSASENRWSLSRASSAPASHVRGAPLRAPIPVSGSTP